MNYIDLKKLHDKCQRLARNIRALEVLAIALIALATVNLIHSIYTKGFFESTTKLEILAIIVSVLLVSVCARKQIDENDYRDAYHLNIKKAQTLSWAVTLVSDMQNKVGSIKKFGS